MKNQVRTLYKQQREQMNPQAVSSLSNRITNHLLASPLWKNSQTIMVYLSFRNEVETTKIIEACWQQNKSVVIPICEKPHTIVPSYLSSWDNLEKNSYGILELPHSLIQPVNVTDIDLILVPGVAFDMQGNRLGFGAGYYDRFMSKLRNDTLKVALCYHQQIHPQPLPIDLYDLPMNYLVTEENLFPLA